MSTHSQVHGCVFCAIVRDKKDEHLGSGPATVVIRDKSPRVPHHYLVLSKVHINKPSDLTFADLDLLREMERIAREHLRDALKEKGEADIVEDMLRMGFHWPPALRINHLHMHVLYPVKDMSWWSRFIFGNGKLFKTTAAVIEELEKAKGTSDPPKDNPSVAFQANPNV